jgi:hypothetical protein
MLSNGLNSGLHFAYLFERANPALVAWRPAQARNGWRESCRRSDIASGSFRPNSSSLKTDTIDAAAIAEAVTRPTMRFVSVKQPEQVDLQALHRIRDQSLLP